MLIPNHAEAQVEAEKLTDYLLSQTHPIGKSKAAWFGVLGYKQSDWQLLQADLTQLAFEDAVLLSETQYGQKYGISSILIGPNGKSGKVMTVWIIISGHKIPRLVTAYPNE